MSRFQQIRNRAPLANEGCALVVACPAMKSNVNISMIARSASCLGANNLIITGQNRITTHISRDCSIPIEHRNSLMPIVQKHKQEGYRIIGLEQATNSQNIYEYEFINSPTMLIVGNECRGMDEDVLNALDDVIEIPLFGAPHSLNVAVATSLCLFEFAKQMR